MNSDSKGKITSYIVWISGEEIMLLYGVIKIVSGFLLIYTFKFLRRAFLDIEIIVFYLFLSTLFEIIHNITSLNMELMKVNTSFLSILILQIDRLIIYPIATVWLLYSVFKIHDSKWLSLSSVIAWSSLHVVTTKLNSFYHVITLKGWNVLVGYIESCIILLFVISLYYFFQSVVKKEELKRNDSTT